MTKALTEIDEFLQMIRAGGEDWLWNDENYKLASAKLQGFINSIIGENEPELPGRRKGLLTDEEMVETLRASGRNELRAEQRQCLRGVE